VKRLNHRQRIEILPWQTPGLLQRAALSATQAKAAAWFVLPAAAGQQVQYRGAAAIFEALAYTTPLLTPLRWLYHLPGIRQLADAIYAWVARNRGRMPGSGAACKIDPNKAP
jgi:predicted DCC family thiol-disulfide oxidoreductase YuxK